MRGARASARIKTHAQIARERPDRRGEAGIIDHPAAPARIAKRQIFPHRQRVDELEMLMHHPDAGDDGLARGAEAHRRAIDENVSGVGSNQARQDVHQRRLAGAVLAQDPQDFACCQRKRDVVIGDDARKALGHAPQLEQGRTRHRRRARGFVQRIAGRSLTLPVLMSASSACTLALFSAEIALSNLP
jgi:hypothetical protein